MVRKSRRQAAFIAAWHFAALAIALTIRPALGQTVDSTLWTFDPGSTVTAITRSGNTLYVGGTFSSVGPASGSGVPFNLIDAVTPLPYPKVSGIVEVALPDGEGGWYMGGSFVGVGGLPRRNLAHILVNGVVADWAPNPDLTVRALALKGQTLYVGGDFTLMGGEQRRGLAALEDGTGRVTAWDPESDYRVSAIIVRGNTVYVGGTFTRIGGQARNHLAALDAKTGCASAWNPDADGEIRTLILHGNTLFLGGEFLHVGGQLRKFLAGIDLDSGEPTTWNPRVDREPQYYYDGGPRVSALAIGRGTLYAAGSFNRVGGESRASLAAFNLESGALTAWDPQAAGWGWNPTPQFNALAVHAGRVYVGGAPFTSLGGRVSASNGGDFARALDASTGQAVEWDPRPNQEVRAFAIGGNTIFMGGVFTSVRDWVPRLGLAALDLTTGAATPWAPEPDGLVRSLVANGSTVYVGGQFSFVGGQPRANIAALDASDGRATAWNPGANGPLWALALSGGRLYVGGWFDRIAGESRENLAAVDTLTGATTAWNPGANDAVFCIGLCGRTLYAGGAFGRMGGLRRIGIAAVDTGSGAVLAWNPNPDGHIDAVAVGDSVVFAGGSFENIGGQARYELAALDTRTGAATSWKADLGSSFDYGPSRIHALALSGSVIYAGGAFSDIGGRARTCLAAVDATTGDVLPWDPDPDRVTWALTTCGETVYAGGSFLRMGLYPSTNIAAISAAQPVTRKQPAIRLAAAMAGQVTLAPIAPNPVLSGATIRFTLALATPASLEIYDIQGRRVETLLDHELQASGQHEVGIRCYSWPAGYYLSRLEADGQVVTQKFVVVK